MEETHQIVIPERSLPLHLGHPSGGLTDGEVDVVEPILGLGVAKRVIAGRLGVGVNMGHAPGVAVERRLTSAGWGCEQAGERPGDALTGPLHERCLEGHRSLQCMSPLRGKKKISPDREIKIAGSETSHSLGGGPSPRKPVGFRSINRAGGFCRGQPAGRRLKSMPTARIVGSRPRRAAATLGRP